MNLCERVEVFAGREECVERMRVVDVWIEGG